MVVFFCGFVRDAVCVLEWAVMPWHLLMSVVWRGLAGRGIVNGDEFPFGGRNQGGSVSLLGHLT